MKSKATAAKQTVSRIKGSTASDWKDKQQIMELFPISSRALQHYRTTKVIPFAKLGGKIFYYLPGLIEALELSASGQAVIR